MEQFDVFVGEWTTEATHPAVEGVVHGHAEFEWLEGRRFLIQRARHDHPDFPTSIAIIGVTDEGLVMNYFDSRGVHRVYPMSLEDGVWRFWRDSPGFSQRFTGEVARDTITCSSELSEDDGKTWNDDFAATYRRVR